MQKLILALCLVVFGSVKAQDCEIVVGSNDDMLFDVRKITISRKCEDFTLTFKHYGKGTKEIMGHNLVIAKLADLEHIAFEGQRFGSSKDYLNVNNPKIIAHTKMLEGGEEDTISFKVANLADNKYGYICTYPGHFVMMRGIIEMID